MARPQDPEAAETVQTDGIKAVDPAAICSRCGRFSARSLADVMQGQCPREWAYRDAMAEEDCNRHANT